MNDLSPTLRGSLPLNGPATFRVLALLREGHTPQAISRLTGYSIGQVMDAIQRRAPKQALKLKEKAKKERAKKRPAPKFDQDDSKKPVFVLDFERTTGLTCVFIRRIKWVTEWAVITSKKAQVMFIWGINDLLQGAKHSPLKVLQGLDKDEWTTRQRRIRKLEEPK